MRSMEMFDVIHFSSLHVQKGDAKTEIIKTCDVTLKRWSKSVMHQKCDNDKTEVDQKCDAKEIIKSVTLRQR